MPGSQRPVMQFSGVRIWLRSSRFLFHNFVALLPILPLLWVPLLSDLLHSVLIREEQSGRRLEAVSYTHLTLPTKA